MCDGFPVAIICHQSRHLPEAAVTALLESGNDLPEGHRLAMRAEEAVLHLKQEVQVLGHDDIGVDGDHGIAGTDAMEQLVLHHLSEGRERSAGCIGAAIGCIRVAHHGAQRLPKGIYHMQGDVVDAWARVVVIYGAVLHAMIGHHTTGYHFTAIFMSFTR